MTWRQRLNAADSDSEAGMTLVELIVASAITVIIMFAASLIFITIMQHEGFAKDTAVANNEAQLSFKQLEYDIRNASRATIMQGGDVMVLATRTANSVDYTSAVCVTYFYDEDAGVLQRFQSTGSTESSAVATAASTDDIVDMDIAWTLFADGVSHLGSARIFGVADATITPPDQEVLTRLSVETSDGRSPIEFDKQITLRTQSDLTLTCN
ncbi:PilW family protein [Demequina salsinemoris]|uniref:PilW family protein n=1 Tax=Demequina salsinemoris TaxID=577470 RepID=UPI000785E93B|nr:prepilin-type N-terminal cleavage/methylation domain-containing protein [Demequina salsinemoris]